MVDSNENNTAKPTITLSKPAKLSLTKTVEGGKVTQNFTHGRSKQVMVEVKKTRTFARKEAVEERVEDTEQAVNQGLGISSVPQIDLASLQVRDKRQIDKASSEVKIAEAEKPEVKASEVVEQAQPEAEENKMVEQSAKPALSSVKEEEMQEVRVVKKFEMQPKIRGALPILNKPAEKKIAAAEQPKSVEAKQPKAADEPIVREKKTGLVETEEKKKIRLKSEDSRRSTNKLTVSQALEYQEERMRSLASLKRQREKTKRDSGGNGLKDKLYREVILPESITVQELANRMSERVADVIRMLMKMGTIAAGAQSIDADTAELVAVELGHSVKRVTEADVENILIDDVADEEQDLLPRPPVVTIMGHVDHGKTSLLDALRKTNVVEGEAGGITQHIGAYQIEAGGQKVTFLDTPGHEAFTAMRARGAKSTDIVVLVVAADDGVKPQTIEAISHARAAEVPIIVAINKIDKPDADVQQVKNELMQHSLIGEDIGGDTQMVEVSAKARLGLTELVETILLQAEILELKANPSRLASGVVIESRIDKGRGTTATLLVQKGTLNVGDIVVAGSSWGKVRVISNDKLVAQKNAVPSQPVEILGLTEPPMAGDLFSVVDSEKTARDITEYRIKKEKDRLTTASAKTLDQLFTEASVNMVKELNVILKGDVQGSVEAIIGSLKKFDGTEVKVKIVHSAVGAISESDISLAQATGSIIFGFNVRAVGGAKALADNEKIDIRYYSIIYDLVDDVKAALSGMLSPERREEILGYAEIRDVFNITKVGKVAGCYVTEGEVRRGAGVRLLRENVVIHEGKLKTLKRFKDEVKEVKQGYECGMAFENYDDIKAGDIIEAYEVKEIARTVQIKETAVIRKVEE
jgi:translation initiation factor IF-2